MLDTKLRSLLKVQETGSFTKAAQELSLTQPAVSQHIATLEKELGIVIFERHNNIISITREGELVIRYAKRMLSLYNNLINELSSKKRQITSITVGITHTAESNAIAGALASYASSKENLSIKILTNTVASLYEMLQNYEVDFAIVEGRINAPNLRYLPLDTDSLVLAISPNHRLADSTMVTIDDLKNEKMILRLPTSNTRNLFVSSLETKAMSIDNFNVVLEIDNIATIKDLVRNDFGVSVLAKSACLEEIRKKKLVCLPIQDFEMLREINLVYLKDFRHESILNEIVKEYRQTSSKS